MPPLLRDGNERWYAVRVQSKYELLASDTLLGKGYEVLLPLYKSVRRWSDRMKTLERPLFPGYLFCRFDMGGRRLPILTTPGVFGIVGAGRTPIPIDDEEITALQLMLRSGLAPEPWPYLTVGSRVLIERGPLAGLEGIVVANRNRWRVVVSVALLQRSVAAEIDRCWMREARAPVGTEAVHAFSGNDRPRVSAAGC